MAIDPMEMLERLRVVLREAGFAELVDEEEDAARVRELSPSAELQDLITLIEKTVVLSMRASADAQRILGEHAPEAGAFESFVPPRVRRDAIVVPLDRDRSRDLSKAADRLADLLRQLRDAADDPGP